MSKTKQQPKELTQQAFNFETALAELNQIVDQIEHGNLTLEESLKNFERGIALTRNCQSALQAAEQKVQMLVQQNGQTQLTSFHEEPENES